MVIRRPMTWCVSISWCIYLLASRMELNWTRAPTCTATLVRYRRLQVLLLARQLVTLTLHQRHFTWHFYSSLINVFLSKETLFARQRSAYFKQKAYLCSSISLCTVVVYYGTHTNWYWKVISLEVFCFLLGLFRLTENCNVKRNWSNFAKWIMATKKNAPIFKSIKENNFRQVSFLNVLVTQF